MNPRQIDERGEPETRETLRAVPGLYKTFTGDAEQQPFTIQMAVRRFPHVPMVTNGSPLRSNLRYDSTAHGGTSLPADAACDDTRTSALRSQRIPREWRPPPSGVALSPWESVIGAGGPITSDRREAPSSSSSVLAQATVVVVFLCSLAGVLGHVHHYVELASHFRLQYLIVALACLLIFVALHAWWSAIGAFATVCLHLAVVVPWYVSRHQPLCTSPHFPVKLLFANVESTQSTFCRCGSGWFEGKPRCGDHPRSDRAMDRSAPVIEERLPYTKALPRPGSVGIALYSRIPIERFDVVPLRT